MTTTSFSSFFVQGWLAQGILRFNIFEGMLENSVSLL